MDHAYYFFVGFGLSFLGSLPIGLITLTIVQNTIQNGKKSGVMIALGATIMEFVYTFIALKSLDMFSENLQIGSTIKIVATIIFFILGIYFFTKPYSKDLKPVKEYNYFDFFRGFLVGLMNLLIVPFWVFIGIWLESNGIQFDNTYLIVNFSFASALGALLAFFLYIWFSGMISGKVATINRYTNKIVGTVFLGLGIFQLFQIL